MTELILNHNLDQVKLAVEVAEVTNSHIFRDRLSCELVLKTTCFIIANYDFLQ